MEWKRWFFYPMGAAASTSLAEAQAAMPNELLFGSCLLKAYGVQVLPRAAFDVDAAEGAYQAIHDLLQHRRYLLLYEYSVSGDVADIVAVLNQNDAMLRDTMEALADHISGAAHRTGRDAV